MENPGDDPRHGAVVIDLFFGLFHPMSTTLTRPALHLFIVSTVLLWGCKHQSIHRSPVFQPPVVVFEPVVRIPTDTLDPAYAGLTGKKDIAVFYLAQQSQPAWTTGNELTPQADTLIGFLQNTVYYGLPATGYHAREVSRLAADRSVLSRQRFDLLLTDAYLALAHDLTHGRLTSRRESRSDSVSLDNLKTVLQNGGLVSSLQMHEPVHPGYHALKACLKFVLDSVSVGLGDTVALHGKVQKIVINMERWRHEIQAWEPRHLVVNIPAYRLDVIDHGDTVLSSRVIVGTRGHPTPELSSIIRSISLYPYWVVPRKIAVEEYLPVIQRDTTFFTRTDFEVLDRKGNLLDPKLVAWNTFHKNNFPVILRQQEGTGNALGVIKFLFENPYAVFLHDTNAKQLFKRSARAFSHGCVRVDKAAALARYLMTGSPSKESVLMKRYLDEQRQAVLSAPRPLPIYVRYFTAEVMYGALFIHPDIYGADVPLYNQLNQFEQEGGL
jgi:L,D-transpeptidase YcbB